MPKAKNTSKKIDRKTALSLAVNFCAMFVLTFTFGLLLLANVADKSSALASAAAALPVNSCATSRGTQSEPAVLFPVSAGEPIEGSIRLVVDDSGYREKKLVLSAQGTKMLEITNKGVNAHSFVIDGMMIDSGAIQPGQTKTIALESLSGKPQSYTFYSNLAGDDREKFGGAFVIE